MQKLNELNSVTKMNNERGGFENEQLQLMCNRKQFVFSLP